MPLYEFYCGDCRGKFEILTTFEASEGDVVCAKCHGEHVRKLFSVFSSPRRSDGFEAADDYGDDFDGGCSCGGACSCQD